MNIWLILITVLLLLSANTLFSQNFSYQKTDEGITVTENGKPVLFYQVKPKTVEGKYERSGYVHPLYDLDGNVLTEDMPEDHPYHRGIFWAWHQIIANGKNVADGWMSENISFNPGKMQVTKSRKNAIVSSQLVWRIKDSIKGEVNLVNEISRINIYAAKPHYRVIDFDILLKPLVDELRLGGSDDPKGYGGFCLRIKLPDDIQFLSGEHSIEPKETAVNAGPWMDFKTGNGGILVFGYKGDENSGSFPWILRRSKSMQNIPYPGREPVVIPPDGLKLNYRVIVHDKNLSAEEIRTLFREFTGK